MAESTIYSSGTLPDMSWRESHRPDSELRARAAVELNRIHGIEHARANSMFTCPICKRWPVTQTNEETR